MRMSSGKLTRRLPKVQPTAADVRLRYKDDGTGKAEYHYVTEAIDPSSCFEDFKRLGGAHDTYGQAKAEAWTLAAKRGGLLLDYQRGYLAEQPLWWEFTIDLSGLDPADFQRKKKGEQRLKRALQGWIGLPSLEALKLARLLIARWRDVRFALTQTEIRKLHQGPGDLTPLSKAMAARVTYREGEVMPAHLAKPYRPSLSAPVAGDVLTGDPYTTAA